ncbi:MAG: hypothetical protein II797_05955, partial [Clostridia bacterium]|nr:hypothetical protein [Clostridia bacterium]
EVVRMVRERFESQTGRSAAGLIVAATHCHTGAPFDWEGHDHATAIKEEVEASCQLIGDCAVMAYRNCQPVRIGFNRGEEKGVSFNRRWFMKDGAAHTWPGIGNPDNVRPAGPVDYEVDVVRVEDLNGKVLGIITNFANHLDLIGGTKYCSDFPGQMSRKIKSVLGQDVVSLFINGCCGDVTHIDYTGNYPFGPEHYIKVGNILAYDVLRINEDIETKEIDSLDWTSRTFEIPRRQYTEEQVAEARETVRAILEKRAYRPAVVSATADDEYAKPTAGDPDDMSLSYAHSAINLYEHPILTDTVELTAIRLGDIAISSMPGEMFAEIGLDFKKRSPFEKNIIVELANGCSGYIGTKKAFSEGGYEVTLDYYTNLIPEGADIITENLLSLQDALL